jgi:hypothetical protein
MNAVPQGCSRSELPNVWGQGAIGGGGLPPLICSEAFQRLLSNSSPRISRLRLIPLDASI